MPTVYLETSFVSYLAAPEREGREAIALAHRQITLEWWSRRRGDFDLVISQVVLDEAQAGNPESARERFQILASIPRLRVTDAVVDLAKRILERGVLPPRAFPDALHIAVATVHRVDYLLTWNCKHIANVEVLPRIAAICEGMGLVLPVICTPEELLGVANDQ